MWEGYTTRFLVASLNEIAPALQVLCGFTAKHRQIPCRVDIRKRRRATLELWNKDVTDDAQVPAGRVLIRSVDLLDDGGEVPANLRPARLTLDDFVTRTSLAAVLNECTDEELGIFRSVEPLTMNTIALGTSIQKLRIKAGQGKSKPHGIEGELNQACKRKADEVVQESRKLRRLS